MYSKNLQPNKTTVEEIFKGNKFIIPLYQRSYDWDKRDIEELLNDVTHFNLSTINDHNRVYFLGNIMSAKEIEQESDEENNNDDDTLLIIDGQQRLTTIVLTVLAIKNIYQKYNQEYKKRVMEFGKNNSSNLLSRYNEVLRDVDHSDLKQLGNIFGTNIQDKIIYKTNNLKTKWSSFFENINNKNTDTKKINTKNIDSTNNFNTNYKLIKKTISEYIDNVISHKNLNNLNIDQHWDEVISNCDDFNSSDLKDVKNEIDSLNQNNEFKSVAIVENLVKSKKRIYFLNSLLNTITKKLLFVLLTIEKEKDSLSIFVNINSTGKALTEVDIIKSLWIKSIDSMPNHKIKYSVQNMIDAWDEIFTVMGTTHKNKNTRFLDFFRYVTSIIRKTTISKTTLIDHLEVNDNNKGITNNANNDQYIKFWMNNLEIRKTNYKLLFLSLNDEDDNLSNIEIKLLNMNITENIKFNTFIILLVKKMGIKQLQAWFIEVVQKLKNSNAITNQENYEINILNFIKKSIIKFLLKKERTNQIESMTSDFMNFINTENSLFENQFSLNKNATTTEYSYDEKTINDNIDKLTATACKKILKVCTIIKLYKEDKIDQWLTDYKKNIKDLNTDQARTLLKAKIKQLY